MPVHKKQDTTSTSSTSTPSSSSQHQVQQSFHQQLREHIRDATRVVMEAHHAGRIDGVSRGRMGGMHSRAKRLSQWKLYP